MLFSFKSKKLWSLLLTVLILLTFIPVTTFAAEEYVADAGIFDLIGESTNDHTVAHYLWEYNSKIYVAITAHMNAGQLYGASINGVTVDTSGWNPDGSNLVVKDANGSKILDLDPEGKAGKGYSWLVISVAKTAVSLPLESIILDVDAPGGHALVNVIHAIEGALEVFHAYSPAGPVQDFDQSVGSNSIDGLAPGEYVASPVGKTGYIYSDVSVEVDGSEILAVAAGATGAQSINEGNIGVGTDGTVTIDLDVAYSKKINVVFNYVPATYTVGLSVSPSGSGNTSGGGTFGYNDAVEISAANAVGWAFVNWTDDDNDDAVVSTNATYNFNMPDNDINYTANFEQLDYTLALEADPVGGGTVTGAGTYNYFDEAQVTATAATGYGFVNWTDEEDNVIIFQANFTYVMPDRNVTLTANFEQIDYTLALEADPVGGGTVTGEGTYNYGDNVQVTATAAAGYGFVNWTDEEGTAVSGEANFTYAMPDRDVKLTANFVRGEYNLSLKTSPAGSGNVGGGGAYGYGDAANVTASPNPGYAFVNWTDEKGKVASATANFTYKMPDRNVTLTANFELIDYTLALEADPVGGGTVTGEGTYNYGDNVQVTATAAAGYGFVNWTDEEGTAVSGEANFTYAMPDRDVKLTANFVRGEYNLSLKTSPAGSGNVGGGGAYGYGDAANVTASPNPGYAFVNWTGERGRVVSSQPNFTYEMPALDVTLTANFELVDYTLALEADPVDGGTVTGEGTYNYGDQVQVTATAATDHIFVNWIDENGVEVSSEANFTYTMPNRNVTLTAVFEEDITVDPDDPEVDPDDPEEPELPETSGSVFPLLAGLLIAGAGLVIKKKR